ncbi:ABC transporter ATP-binding protein [Cohnella massiliensis]|uniref:ABC transporter ATP-binding protein n=1 Tax=Cohnella massiliensis TaxID=1816691 RepID=UPI0009B9BA9B|nr:ABC transporter ATP-binding protein [Cohnella massiliensis]
MILANRLGKTYDGRRVLSDIGFSVYEGEIFGIIGPNGSGKSTLLKLLSGVEKADEGEVALGGATESAPGGLREVRGGRTVGSFTRKELARFVAVLEQEALPKVGFTVREVTEMGRFPYQNWLGEEPESADERIDAILADLGLAELAERTLEFLSGGERQRVALAKVMAQEPRLLMLDEPTTYLDIGRQIQLMDSIRLWQRRAAGLTVVAVLHDLNLAALYCDRLLLIDKGKAVGIGTPEELLTEERIRSVYGVGTVVTKHPATGAPQILLQPEAAGHRRDG